MGPTAWSYSAWALYEQCPLKYKLLKIDKMSEPQSPAMARGNEIHNKIDSFLKGVGELPPEAQSFKTVLVDLKALEPFGEQRWAFNKQWGATTYFGKDVWLRVIVDAGKVFEDGYCTIIDWKTGKKYDENREQLDLFALATFKHYAEVREVETRLAYVDSGEEVVWGYKREDVPALQADWERRVTPMFNDTLFAPKPNSKCRWCHFRRENGGPCKF